MESDAERTGHGGIEEKGSLFTCLDIPEASRGKKVNGNHPECNATFHTLCAACIDNSVGLAGLLIL